MSSLCPSRPTAITALDSRNKDPCPPHPLWDIGLGCIAWLPQGYRPPSGSTFRDPPESASDHPIIVLSIADTDPEDAIISFALLRSFTSTGGPDTLVPGFGDQYVELLRRIPWSKNTPVSLPQLMLEHRPQRGYLAKTSYIDVSVVYSARWKDLRVYDTSQASGSFFRLNKKSFTYVREQRMKGCVGLEAEWTWVRTDQLKEDFATRVKRLETTATPTTSFYSGINSFMVLLLPLLSTIAEIVVGIFSQRDTPATTTWLHGVLGILLLQLQQALTRTHAGAATPEARTTTREKIHAAARTLFVLSSSFNLVSLGVLSLCINCFKTLATQRTETRVPAQAAASVAPGMGRPGDQDEVGWEEVLPRKSAHRQRG